MVIQIKTLILALVIARIVIYLAMIFILFLQTFVEHETIIARIKTIAKEREAKAIMAKKEKERNEAKIHIETRIGNFLQANKGTRFTEQELKMKVTVNTRDLISFHGILVTLVHYQHRSGYGIEVDNTNPKEPIFYYYYEKPN